MLIFFPTHVKILIFGNKTCAIDAEVRDSINDAEVFH